MFDLHIHSKYSPDSNLSPLNIIKIAKKSGLDGVAVMDHFTIKGGIETYKSNNHSDFIVIVGSEIKTEYGDIIGLSLSDEIKSRIFIQVIEEIKEQDGLVILAHPFRKGILFPNNLLSHIELIEAFNSRSPRCLNAQALNLAKKFQKPVISGSDAHFGFEIGNGKTIVSDDVKCALVEGKQKSKEKNQIII